jgi:hypothetical protein
MDGRLVRSAKEAQQPRSARLVVREAEGEGHQHGQDGLLFRVDAGLLPGVPGGGTTGAARPPR